jgi:myo-inositol catabolism protein IolC
MTAWQPRHDDPLLILAMDHRDSPAKTLVFDGLLAAAPKLTSGRAGILVDERYGQEVIGEAHGQTSPVVLAVPIEASGNDWFALQWGDEWLEHVARIRPDYAKVLVRDNPDFDSTARSEQLDDLAEVSAELSRIGVPLMYELLVPATSEQLAQAGRDTAAYDRDIRPDLVTQVIADNQQFEVAPALWQVEGLETVEAARQVADQARTGERPADLIVLGGDAPAARIDHWLSVASEVPAFTGFAIGRGIWAEAVRDYQASDRGDEARARARDEIASRYLGFVSQWRP